MLSKEEERKLIEHAFSGDEIALEKLILNNLGIVKSKVRFRNIPLHIRAEATSAGVMGLVIAARKANPKFKNRFSTYAGYWINFYLDDFMQRMAYPVHVPKHYKENYNATAFKVFIDPSKEEAEGPSLVHDLPINIDFEDDHINSFTLKKLLRQCTKREQLVTIYKFGLEGNSLTYREIGEILNIHEETVRLIQKKAINKMKQYAGVA